MISSQPQVSVSFPEALEKIRGAIKKTREVANDPDLILNQRKLPKAGKNKMVFENVEYEKSVRDARNRVRNSYRDENS